MKNLLYIIVAFTAFCFVSCDPENVIKKLDSIKESDPRDYIWDAASEIKITLNETSISTSDAKKVKITGSTATITSVGNYKISGKILNGQIVVNVKGKGIVRLILNNAEITNSSSSAIYIARATKTVIILPDGTKNTLIDGENYNTIDDNENSTIYSKDYLAFFGKGKLYVTGNYDGGITGRNELFIESGDISVNSVGCGIRGRYFLIINDGNIEINSGDDGLKSNSDKSPTYGFVEINGGNFNINSAGDGISALTDLTINDGTFNIKTGGGSDYIADEISSKGIKSKRNILITGGELNFDCADHAIGATDKITVTDGTLNIKSARKAINADTEIRISGGNISVTGSNRGFNAHRIIIEGGQSMINTERYCIKAALSGSNTTDSDGSKLIVSGGKVALVNQRSKAFQSLGDILVSGGTLVIQGSANEDNNSVYYQGNFSVIGGTLALAGNSIMMPNSATTTQYVVKLNFRYPQLAGRFFCIRESVSQSDIFVMRAAKMASNIVASLPQLEANKDYEVFSGGIDTGVSFNGFYADATYFPGTKIGSFTTSEEKVIVLEF